MKHCKYMKIKYHKNGKKVNSIEIEYRNYANFI